MVYMNSTIYSAKTVLEQFHLNKISEGQIII